MNTLTTYESLSNYISNVRQWLSYAYIKIEILENRTNKISLLANNRFEFVNFLKECKFTKMILETFRTKANTSLSNFSLCDTEANLKMYENLLTTLQLEYSVICILHCPETTPHIKDFFSKSLLIINEIKQIDKDLRDLDILLERLLII